MAKTLLVPDHILQKRKKDKASTLLKADKTIKASTLLKADKTKIATVERTRANSTVIDSTIYTISAGPSADSSPEPVGL